MSAIKQAIVYKAEIPVNANALTAHLQEHVFTDLLLTQRHGAGFVPVTPEHGLVATFHGGLAFRVRIDEKILPASVIAAEVEKRCAKIKEETGRPRIGKKERSEIKEQVIYDLTCAAFSNTVASLVCYFHFDTGYLIVPTTSQKIADVCVTQLIGAVGSVKTETINVSDVKHGLTTRLSKWLATNGDEGFGEFEPRGEAAMVDTLKRAVTVKMDALDGARDALSEALLRGMSVKSIGFNFHGTNFRLTQDFRLRGINTPEIEESGEDGEVWEASATMEVQAVCDIVSALAAMLSYKDNAAEGGAA